MRNFGSVDEFVAFLETVPARVVQAERAGLEAAGKLLERDARQMIGEEIREWPELAPSTVEEKDRLGYTGRISETDPLYRTGELRLSIDHAVDEHGVTLGSTDPLAPWFEDSTKRMPPRPFIGPTLFRLGHDAVDLIANHLMGGVAGKPGTLVPVPQRDGDATE